jgi:hypothetical protein
LGCFPTDCLIALPHQIIVIMYVRDSVRAAFALLGGGEKSVDNNLGREF